MAAELPPTFVSLDAGYRQTGTQVNLIGVCVDHLPITKSRGSDFTVKFTLHDPEWIQGIGMPFQFFNLREAKLPSIQNTGDVLIIRNIKSKTWQGQPKGLSNLATSWVVLDGSTVLGSKCEKGSDIKFEKCPLAGCPSVPELAYAKYIASMENPNIFCAPAASTTLQIAAIMSKNGGMPPAAKEKFSLVQNLKESVFSDIIGEVRRIYANDYRVELSVTDYTAHPQLFNYTDGMEEEGTEGDQYGYVSSRSKEWRGPWGKRTILITLWDAHAAYAQQTVREGDYVSFHNVQIAMDDRGGKLEGHCRGDRRYPDKINIAILKPRDGERDKRLSDLLKRKLEYHKQAKVLYDQSSRVAGSSKDKTESKMDEGEQKRSISRKAKNREKKERKRARYEALQGNGRIRPAIADRTNMTLLDPKTSCNPQVRCKDYAVPLKTIDDILDFDILKRTTAKGNAFSLPFQNCKYKSKVRVVDFFPDSIADFAAPRRITEYDDLSGYDSDSEDDQWLSQVSGSDLKWEWRFMLLVEDATIPIPVQPERRAMEILVADLDGDFLLNMDACDLRRRPEQVEILREKLFILWGNLEEAKQEAHTSDNQLNSKSVRARPFECCIKEYGVTTKGADEGALKTERMFRMFGTTIK